MTLLDDPRLPDRFWDKVIAPESTKCWLWIGARCRDGYGNFYWYRNYHGAHRLAYTVLVDMVSSTQVLDHLCRVRRCVNPAHMEPVTDAVNIRRSPIARATLNALKTHCVNGHAFAGPNMRISKRGERVCRTCAAEAMSRFHARKRAAQ